MENALWLLALFGILGTFDTLYYHEYKGQLPARLPAMRPELKLHAFRDFIYAVIFGTLPWFAWHGFLVIALSLLLLAEIVITISDFIVEDRVRKAIGGMFPGERATHALLGIVFGTMLAHLVPVLIGWWGEPTALVLKPPPVPLVLRIGLTLGAFGILISGIRDLYAAMELPKGNWPWRVQETPEES